MSIADKVKKLRRKERAFRRAGDLSRAVHCKIIADFLEESLNECGSALAVVSEVKLCGK